MTITPKDALFICAITGLLAVGGGVVCLWGYVRLGELEEAAHLAASISYEPLIKKIEATVHGDVETQSAVLAIRSAEATHSAWATAVVGWRSSLKALFILFAAVSISALFAFECLRRSNHALKPARLT